MITFEKTNFDTGNFSIINKSETVNQKMFGKLWYMI